MQPQVSGLTPKPAISALVGGGASFQSGIICSWLDYSLVKRSLMVSYIRSFLTAE